MIEGRSVSTKTEIYREIEIEREIYSIYRGKMLVL